MNIFRFSFAFIWQIISGLVRSRSLVVYLRTETKSAFIKEHSMKSFLAVNCFPNRIFVRFHSHVKIKTEMGKSDKWKRQEKRIKKRSVCWQWNRFSFHWIWISFTCSFAFRSFKITEIEPIWRPHTANPFVLWHDTWENVNEELKTRGNCCSRWHCHRCLPLVEYDFSPFFMFVFSFIVSGSCNESIIFRILAYFTFLFVECF